MPNKRKPARGGKAGRPRVDFDLEILADLGKLQCTHEEVAATFHCHVDTFRRALRENEEIFLAYNQAMEQGKKSLRRVMWQKALEGSERMMEWLSIQHLGYHSRASVKAEITGRAKVVRAPAKMETAEEWSEQARGTANGG